MTVVHINIGLGGGGAEHVLLELSKKGNEDNIKMIVVAIANIDQIEYKFTDQEIEVQHLNINSIKSFFKGLKKLHSIVNPINDVVFHCHMFHGLLIGLSYSLIYKKTPIIFTLHNILVEHIYRRWILFFTKPIRNADINFSNTSNKWYLKPVEVIANGVDFKKFNTVDNRSYNKDIEKFIFLFLGRIEEQKNPLILIDFVSDLIKYGENNFQIHIAGDGIMRKELECLILKNKYQNYIKILGFQKNVKQIMEKSHCLILPSLWEGLPISLIEASANKLPIITTPVGSIPEYFNNTNACVIEVSQFSFYMYEVMRNYNNAIMRAEKLLVDNKSVFDIEAVYEKHKLLYLKHSKYGNLQSISPIQDTDS
ncbi:MAG TPA: glycosyltransferase family 4 protein [Edaphocola sp.]|nr:glycosyltransferase family 4 protein [Edaphocola sp.]